MFKQPLRYEDIHYLPINPGNPVLPMDPNGPVKPAGPIGPVEPV